MSLEDPLESLLGREGLARLGAIMAVDGEGVLRGIVTVDRVAPGAPARLSWSATASGSRPRRLWVKRMTR